MASSLLPLTNRTLIKLQFPASHAIDLRDFSGGYNTRDSEISVADNELTGGQNVDLLPDKSIAKREGHTLFGNYMGSTTGTLGIVTHEPPGGTSEILAAYDTVVNRYVSGVWTPLTGVSMTTNRPVDSAYFPLTAKTYIVNQTDNVVKYASGASADQTDSAFKKGKYILQFKNRLLVANVTSQENFVWFTDLGVDTFSSNNYLEAVGEITGLVALYDKWLTFTKRSVYVTNNFTFNTTAGASGPDQFTQLGTDFGALYERTVIKTNNLVYFLGQDSQGLAAVYVTDGLNVAIVSDTIRTDLNALSPAQLTNACATSYGRFYRLSVDPSGTSTNTHEYLFDTVSKKWLPPYINGVGGFSCYGSITTAGQLDVYGGSQTDGRVYKLNQANYDETLDQSLVTGQDSDGPVDANPAKRAAQSFRVSAAAPRGQFVTGATVYVKKNTGTTTGLTLRIETDNAGVPSGTLASANLTGTIAAVTATSYGWQTVKFATPSKLAANTRYWLVLEHTAEGAGSSQYFWGYKAAGTYANGNGATYASSAWTAQTARDYLFGVFVEGNIPAWADTKAFYLSPQGQFTHVQDIFVTAKASGPWNIQVGVNTGEYSGFSMDDLVLGSNGPVIGSTLVVGQSTLGGQARVEDRLRFQAVRGKTIKFRVQNLYDNEPFTVYGFRTRHEISSKLK